MSDTEVTYRWYAIQTTAGHENKVRMLLEQRIKDDPRPEGQKLVARALVPTQEVVEIKNGKKVTVERKLYPGYVIVQMGLSQEAQHVVNSIQGVIKFVGTGKAPLATQKASPREKRTAGLISSTQLPSMLPAATLVWKTAL